MVNIAEEGEEEGEGGRVGLTELSAVSADCPECDVPMAEEREETRGREGGRKGREITSHFGAIEIFVQQIRESHLRRVRWKVTPPSSHALFECFQCVFEMVLCVGWEMRREFLFFESLHFAHHIVNECNRKKEIAFFFLQTLEINQGRK